MFSFRRKPQKQASDDGGPPFIRSSPSLPELSAQGIPWPSNLVDVSELPQDEPPPPRGAAKTSFSAARGTVPFHKPWTSPGKAVESNGTGPISSLYMSHPPSAFEPRKGSLQGRATADEI